MTSKAECQQYLEMVKALSLEDKARHLAAWLKWLEVLLAQQANSTATPKQLSA